MQIIAKDRFCFAVSAILTVAIGMLVGRFRGTLPARYMSYFFYASAACVLLCLSYRIRNNTLLQQIGKQTYIIYFLHMQFGMSVANKLLMLANPAMSEWIAFFARPTLNLLSVYVGAMILSKSMEKIGLAQYKWIFGLK